MWKYLGNGFVLGVPAIDLTDEQAKEYGEKRLLKSGCYKKANNKNYKVVEKTTKDGE